MITFVQQQLHALDYIEFLEDYTNIEPKSETGKRYPKTSAKTLCAAVTEYVINEILPRSTIENESFRKLIRGLHYIDFHGTGSALE